jgi:hypothetical protein
MIFRFFLENERDYRRSSHSLRIFYEVSWHVDMIVFARRVSW